MKNGSGLGPKTRVLFILKARKKPSSFLFGPDGSVSISFSVIILSK